MSLNGREDNRSMHQFQLLLKDFKGQSTSLFGVGLFYHAIEICEERRNLSVRDHSRPLIIREEELN